jgi:hypothetical protein
MSENPKGIALLKRLRENMKAHGLQFKSLNDFKQAGRELQAVCNGNHKPNKGNLNRIVAALDRVRTSPSDFAIPAQEAVAIWNAFVSDVRQSCPIPVSHKPEAEDLARAVWAVFGYSKDTATSAAPTPPQHAYEIQLVIAALEKHFEIVARALGDQGGVRDRIRGHLHLLEQSVSASGTSIARLVPVAYFNPLKTEDSSRAYEITRKDFIIGECASQNRSILRDADPAMTPTGIEDILCVMAYPVVLNQNVVGTVSFDWAGPRTRPANSKKAYSELLGWGVYKNRAFAIASEVQWTMRTTIELVERLLRIAPLEHFLAVARKDIRP